MPQRRPETAVAEPLRALFGFGRHADLSDAELLARYLGGRAEEAEAAFAALVERHGPMVRHVCRAVLGDPHEAADAFQATFLVLARRAGSIRRAESVGPFLFGVARRVSRRALAAAARRRRAERSLADHLLASSESDPEADRPDDWSALYAELDRLPSRYRDPLVLCYLEGLGHEQAAARLGCPIATLRTRLARGRDRLRDRLTRRGLAPTASLALPAAAPASRLALPASWTSAAARLATASRVAAASSPAVGPIAASTLRRLTMTTILRSLALGGMAFGGLGAGLAGLATRGGPGDGPPTTVPAPPAIAAQDEAPPAPVAEDEPVESAPNFASLRCPVEGTSIIAFLCPDGEAVTEGQLVCVLDQSDLSDQLLNQQIAVERSKADAEDAAEAFEVARFHLDSHTKLVAPAERDSLQGEVRLARIALDIARAKRDRAAKLLEREVVDALAVREAEYDVLRAEFDLERAEQRVLLFEQYDEPTTRRELERLVTAAETRLHAMRMTLELEQEKEQRLRRKIEQCKLKAPFDGFVRCEPGVGAGAEVNAHQAILSVVPRREDPEEDRP